MTEIEASRTLVKSPPELWAECSEASTLARHLGRFGEITITRLEPESAVAWEGTIASGTVRLEPSGWGTKVILTAQQLDTKVDEPVTAPTPAVEEPAEVPPLNVPVRPIVTHRQGGLLARLLGRRRAPQPPQTPVAASARAPERTPQSDAQTITQEPERVSVPDVDPEAVLAAALESLGQAHHRPFSRG